VNPQELVATVCPEISELGSNFYFTPETIAVGEGLGLDVFQFYVVGRGGVLGDVEPDVVASAFGYFNPSVLASMWNPAREICAPRKAGRLYLECSAELGRARFATMEGLGAFCAAAEAVNEAADPVGLALYAAVSAEPLVDDLAGRAMQLVTVLREFRGSAHLLAVRACGLDAKVAHAIRRPDDVSMFGWGEHDIPPITDDHRATLGAADELTDRLVLPAYSVLDDEGATALVEGMRTIRARLAGA
jgi:hypothetical protein